MTHPALRTVPLLLLVTLPACGNAEREREITEAARAATVQEIERILSETIRDADRLAGSADHILEPLPIMTPAQEQALRRFLGAQHVARSRTLSVRVRSDAERDSLVAAGRLVQLEDSTRHWIVREDVAPAYAVPEVHALLELLAGRFQDRLAEMELPPYRLEVTSALRTSEYQAELRGSNTNAAAGVSSHEFGTTVDISYAAFAPPADAPEEILSRVPPQLAPHMERIVDLAFESVSGRKSRELGAIFSQVLQAAQAEGLALVIYERQQTVYHVTVAR